MVGSAMDSVDIIHLKKSWKGPPCDCIWLERYPRIAPTANPCEWDKCVQGRYGETLVLKI
jgi:hypothetical protein